MRTRVCVYVSALGLAAAPTRRFFCAHVIVVLHDLHVLVEEIVLNPRLEATPVHASRTYGISVAPVSFNASEMGRVRDGYLFDMNARTRSAISSAAVSSAKWPASST